MHLTVTVLFSLKMKQTKNCGYSQAALFAILTIRFYNNVTFLLLMAETFYNLTTFYNHQVTYFYKMVCLYLINLQKLTVY